MTMKKIVFICSYILYSVISNYTASPVQIFFQVQALKDKDDAISPLYADVSMHPCEIIAIVAEIVSEVYNVKESAVYKRLQNKKVLYKINLQKLRLNLLAQTRNYKKLKEALDDESEISPTDLKTLLFFVEGKRYYQEFEELERYAVRKKSIQNRDYQECMSLISFLQNEKEIENNKT
jgi:hypothetical protein